MKIEVRKGASLGRGQQLKLKNVAVYPWYSAGLDSGAWRDSSLEDAPPSNRREVVTHLQCPKDVSLPRGVLYVKDIPRGLREQVLAVLLREAEQDSIEHPQHEVVNLSDVVDGYKLTTNSSEMTRRIGKKVQTVFHTCELSFTCEQGQHPHHVTRVVFVTSEYF